MKFNYIKDILLLVDNRIKLVVFGDLLHNNSLANSHGREMLAKDSHPLLVLELDQALVNVNRMINYRSCSVPVTTKIYCCQQIISN